MSSTGASRKEHFSLILSDDRLLLNLVDVYC